MRTSGSLWPTRWFLKVVPRMSPLFSTSAAPNVMHEKEKGARAYPNYSTDIGHLRVTGENPPRSDQAEEGFSCGA